MQPRDITDLRAIQRLRKKQQDLLQLIQYDQFVEQNLPKSEEKIAEELYQKDLIEREEQ